MPAVLVSATASSVVGLTSTWGAPLPRTHSPATKLSRVSMRRVAYTAGTGGLNPRRARPLVLEIRIAAGDLAQRRLRGSRRLLLVDRHGVRVVPEPVVDALGDLPDAA